MSSVTIDRENVESSGKMQEECGQRRSGLQIMGKMIGLVRPLAPVMGTAVFLGTVGYLCAIFLTILAGFGVVSILTEGHIRAFLPWILVILAVLRGVLHYGEQYCNHYIAFKLLAIIRHKVFAALRKLCPAKLEGKDRGNLISIITSDIELLEVFYAHTVSPIAIGVITALIMVGFLGSRVPLAGVIALVGYVVVGAVIPLYYGGRGAESGMKFRTAFGDLNSFILDSLRGLDETIQYGQGRKRQEEMGERSRNLGKLQRELNRLEASQKSLTNLIILLCSFGMFFLTLSSYRRGAAGFDDLLICTIGMMGSFGPMVALSNLSNNLNQTLASAERVLSLLEETPQVEEITGQPQVAFGEAHMKNVDFAYEEELILKDFSMVIPKGEILGIHGASGSGKSTILKLLMRFWDVDQGKIEITGRDIRRMNTENLRQIESYVTQETCLFHDSIANNIRFGKPEASLEEIQEAAKKASVHEFIMNLPKGYETEVGELGDTLSGGERQRIGIARAFLHDAPLLLLEEPTSNLDALNEGVILKALRESCEQKTVVLVSHRKSTLNVADRVYSMGR